MSFETITADVLFQTSRKRICEVARQQFVALGQADEYDRIRRHPDTCQSRVLTLAEADELWASRLATPSLLGDMGMTIYSLGDFVDPRLVFLTDDVSYGWKVLKARGWFAMTYRYRGTVSEEFPTWREHVQHYYGRTVQVVETVDELLQHLNSVTDAQAA